MNIPLPDLIVVILLFASLTYCAATVARHIRRENRRLNQAITKFWEDEKRYQP